MSSPRDRLDAVAQLHEIRAAFGALLRSHPKLRETVRCSHHRYLQMVDEHRSVAKSVQNALRERAREILRTDLLTEATKEPADGWHTFTVRGLFPTSLVTRANANRGAHPPELKALLARAALHAMEWEDRLRAAKGRAEEERRWKEWTKKYRAGEEAEHSVHVRFRFQTDLVEPPDPASLDWEGLRALPRADRVALAHVRLAGLWDTLSLDPLVPALPRVYSETSDPDREFNTMMRWVSDYAVRPRGPKEGLASVPTLDPRKLPPELAWLLLELVESSRASRSGRLKISLPRGAKQPLSGKPAAVFKILLDLPEWKALLGRELLDALAQLRPAIYMDQSTLTRHMMPKLRPHGVASGPNGYYILPSHRPGA